MYFQLQVHCGCCQQVLVLFQKWDLSGDLHDWSLRNCLGDERQSHSVFPVIDWWPVGCVLSLAWSMLGRAPDRDFWIEKSFKTQVKATFSLLLKVHCSISLQCLLAD